MSLLSLNDNLIEGNLTGKRKCHVASSVQEKGVHSILEVSTYHLTVYLSISAYICIQIQIDIDTAIYTHICIHVQQRFDFEISLPLLSDSLFSV